MAEHGWWTIGPMAAMVEQAREAACDASSDLDVLREAAMRLRPLARRAVDLASYSTEATRDLLQAIDWLARGDLRNPESAPEPLRAGPADEGRMGIARGLYLRYRRMWSSDGGRWEHLADDQRETWAEFVAPWVDLATDSLLDDRELAAALKETAREAWDAAHDATADLIDGVAGRTFEQWWEGRRQDALADLEDMDR